MTKFFTTSLGRLRLITFLEGITLLGMVFVTIPIRLYYGIDTYSKILGQVHGALFVLFVVSTLLFAYENNWKFKERTLKVLLASVIPFGTFYIDHKILKHLK